jgi:hypothetical protein
MNRVRLALSPIIGAVGKNQLRTRKTFLRLWNSTAWTWQRRKDNPMIIVYELAAIGAAAIAAISIWHRIQVQRRIRAIDARLARMQKEIDILQMQESRRVMMALKGTSNVDSPALDPDDGNAGDIIDGEVVRLMDKPRATPVP